MSLSVFIDVMIGIALMYFVLSLMCTTLNELIATALKLRANLLSRTLTQIIDNEAVRKAFYNNGLIAIAKAASRGGAAPSGTAVATQARGQEADPAGEPTDKGHPSYLYSGHFAMALLDSLDPGAQTAPATQRTFPSIDDIQRLVGDMADSDIRDVLLASLATAKGDLDTLRDNLASWFDQTMDRLSGDYKRLSKRIALGVGIVVAVVLNADSLAVATSLWNDEGLRNQIVSAAHDTLASQAVAAACPETDPVEKAACLGRQLHDQQGLLRPFPIGWSVEKLPRALESWDTFNWGLQKVFGLLWTGLALSLGAPFWFDLLQKFMNVRGTGPNPAEKKDKA